MPSLAEFSLTRYSYYYSRSAHQTTTTIISTCQNHPILFVSFFGPHTKPTLGLGGKVGAAIRVLIGDKDDKETDSFCTLADRHYRESVFVPMVTCIMPHHLPLPPQNLLIIMKSPEWPAYLCTIEVPSRSQIIVQFEKSGMLISYFYNIVIIVSSNWLDRCYCWMVPSTNTSTMRSLKSS